MKIEQSGQFVTEEGAKLDYSCNRNLAVLSIEGWAFSRSGLTELIDFLEHLKSCMES